MQTFRNLRLSARLGAAFGLIIVALLVAPLVSLHGLGNVNARADALSHDDRGRRAPRRPSARTSTATGYRVVRHLYVEDGDLKAEDKTAKEIADYKVEAGESMAGLRPLLRTPEARAKFEEFKQQLGTFDMAVAKAIRQSRKETVDQIDERDGSRTTYLDEVRPVFEHLDVLHDQLEEAVSGIARGDVKAANDTHAAARRTVLLVVLFAVLAAIALAVVVTRSVTRPVAASCTRCAASTRTACAASATASADRRGRPHPRRRAGHHPGRGPLQGRARPAVGDVQQHARQGRRPHREPTTPCASELGALIGEVAARRRHGRPPPRSRWPRPPTRPAARSARSPPPSATSPRAPSARCAWSSPRARPSRRPRAPRASAETAAATAEAAERGARRRPRRRRAPRARRPRRSSRSRRVRRPSAARSRTSPRKLGADRRHRRHDHRHRRADQPAGAQRRDRGRPRRRAGPRLRGRRRGGPQARRGVRRPPRARSPR